MGPVGGEGREEAPGPREEERGGGRPGGVGSDGEKGKGGGGELGGEGGVVVGGKVREAKDETDLVLGNGDGLGDGDAAAVDGDDEKDGITEQNKANDPTSTPEEGAIALVGGVGCDFVSRVLSTFAPQEAVRDIQEKTKVRDTRYNSVFGLLQQMGKSRAEVNKSLLGSLTQILLRRIHMMKASEEDAMLDLLESSFIYIRIPEVRSIPIAVLERLKAVPNNFLKQLSADKAVFDNLPQSVQRQVWELDKSLLQQHVSPLIYQYSSEKHTTLSCLNMNEENPNKKFSSMSVPSVHRQTYRSASGALKKITSIIDKSNKIYKYIVNLCLTLYRESEKNFMSKEELAYCSFRSQLLMTLHDGMNEIRTADPCHRLAWVLDVSVKERKCGEKRVNELMQIFRRYDKQNRKKRAGRGQDLDPHGGGSTSQPDESTVLGEMGMILRDPPVYFFLAREVFKRLQAVVTGHGMPKQDDSLIFLSRLLQIAAECRSMLREKSFKFYKVDNGLVRDFYPRVCASLIDRALAIKGKQVDPRAVDPKMTTWLVTNGVAQAVYQAFALDCLGKKPPELAEQSLMTVFMALSQLPSKAMVEWSPFMYSLCEKLVSLVTQKAIKTDASLWELAVDQILLKAVNYEVEVHSKLLQLLEAAFSSGELGADKVVRYLEQALENSEKSRKRFRKKQMKLLHAMEDSGNAGNSSDGVNDGIHPSYKRLASKLGDDAIPAQTKLYDYLNQHQQKV